MKTFFKKLFHFHNYKHIKSINQSYESRSDESLEQCRCGKRRIKCRYWEGETVYFYHHEYNRRYL